MFSFQEQLRHKQKFNLIGFDSKACMWQARLVEVNEKSLSQAWSWIRGLSCRGSTNTLAALRYSLNDPATQAIYLLTDGRPDQVEWLSGHLSKFGIKISVVVQYLLMWSCIANNRSGDAVEFRSIEHKQPLRSALSSRASVFFSPLQPPSSIWLKCRCTRRFRSTPSRLTARTARPTSSCATWPRRAAAASTTGRKTGWTAMGPRHGRSV